MGPLKSHRKQFELKEARKSGLAAPEVDEDGRTINPHIPQYMSSAPWYLNAKGPSLKHQRKWKSKESYDAKRDRWNGYDFANYARDVVRRYDARDETRREFLKEQHLKQIDDEAKVDESDQIYFAKLEKRVRTTGGGSTGTVRNLRIREDTAKYLLNLDVTSAYYDPKTRSMREDPLPNTDPNEKFYGGDNQNRVGGQAQDFKLLNVHAFDRGYQHPQAAPSQAELLYNNYKSIKEKLKSQTKNAILEKYGNAAARDNLPLELLLGQTEFQIEYDRAGRVLKGLVQEIHLPKSKYDEDVLINNHKSVWGSWWKDHDQLWGYKCCKQTIRNSYCTGAAGIEAAEASLVDKNL